MSCYEWERGEWKLPTKEFSRFRKELISRINASIDGDFRCAKSMVQSLKNAAKGHRKFDYESAYRNLVGRSGISNISHVFESIVNTKGKPCNPKKKDFKHLNSTTQSINADDDASITFDSKYKVVTWHVPENNHACEHAANTIAGKAFWQILNTVKWTNRTGGQLIGNDEYHSDNHDVGGGGNYIKGRWGNKK